MTPLGVSKRQNLYNPSLNKTHHSFPDSIIAWHTSPAKFKKQTESSALFEFNGMKKSQQLLFHGSNNWSLFRAFLHRGISTPYSTTWDFGPGFYMSPMFDEAKERVRGCKGLDFDTRLEQWRRRLIKNIIGGAAMERVCKRMDLLGYGFVREYLSNFIRRRFYWGKIIRELRTNSRVQAANSQYDRSDCCCHTWWNCILGQQDSWDNFGQLMC